MPGPERIPTGIPGLDQVLGGGWIKGGFIVLSGGTGTGKTTLTVQSVYYMAMNLGMKGYIASFEEGREALEKYMSTYGWDLKKLEEMGLIKIEDYFGVYREGLADLLSYMITRALEFRASVMVIDSISTMLLYAKEKADARTLLDALKKIKPSDMTVLATSNVLDTNRSKAGIEEIIADMLIYLDNVMVGDELRTRLLVVKARGGRHSRKFHQVVFTSKGAEVIGWV